MNNIQTLNKHYEIATWGILLIWLGIRDLIPGLPNGTGLLGLGIILLGLNLVRTINKIPVSAFSITLGALACILAIVTLLGRALNIPGFELPFFPALLIVIGLYLLIPRSRRVEST